MIDAYRLAWPFIRLLDPEDAHKLAILALKTGLLPASKAPDDPILATTVWGKSFPNPIGLAAGFDKNAEVADAMLKQGFGFVEVGTVTPRPQPGNPRPRLFRLTSDHAVINRFGFNNQGLDAVKARLSARQGRAGIVGANVGKNKTTQDAAADYEKGVAAFAPSADYLVVNVSSPNTPGLRTLQGKDELTELLSRTRAALPASPPPLLLKVAPDLTDSDKADIAAVALEQKLDGLIVSNTTLARPDTLSSSLKTETGGLSGAPLFEPSTRVLGEFYHLTGGKLPLIGVGGVASGAQAYAKIRAGASLVQLYSALVYGGPGLVNRIKTELAACLRADGFDRVAQAVGADQR
ncbi:MAG: dihydroorotate dehydrogenase (quinone) [Alphaproteobacteria bacterium RIFOXYD12_FULL_60_8]|nr:MAG: dihydroorotate dehydrogenase (quinone) [Alphaproteobacteria bacterium RIFOXYD12_FULL_60_8]